MMKQREPDSIVRVSHLTPIANSYTTAPPITNSYTTAPLNYKDTLEAPPSVW